jgi:ADP-ribosyl-[dinitrogen reductase] hydrolase
LVKLFCSTDRVGIYPSSCCSPYTTRKALIRFERTGDPVAGSTDPQSAGNGSLTRLAPVAIRHHADLASAIEVAQRQSLTTHAAAASVDACGFFAELLVRAVNGVDRAALFSPQRFLGHSEIAAVADGRYLNKKRSEIMASGYVVHTLEAALWCVYRSTDFREAVLLAANLGEDADTVAAVTGQLAGAIWGESLRNGVPSLFGVIISETGPFASLSLGLRPLT